MPVPDKQSLIEVRVEGIRFGARDINVYEFVKPDGTPLPPSAPGAHIDVHLPGNIVRQYSLIQAGLDTNKYAIGVKLDAQSRGGSSYMHHKLRVGSALTISAPRNNFPLNEAAPHSILFAGGIGITPIWCMWRRLKSVGGSSQLYYSSRSRRDVVFHDQLANDAAAVLHLDDESSGGVLDLQKIIGAARKDAHLYCCGPLPMLKAFESAAASWPAEQVHVEYFTPQAEAAVAGGFTVKLARSGTQVKIVPGQTILSALRAAGVDAPYSCEEGLCGACMTTVLSGMPDHRDTVLTPAERAANNKIMICCSGSKDDVLVLDL